MEVEREFCGDGGLGAGESRRANSGGLNLGIWNGAGDNEILPFGDFAM